MQQVTDAAGLAGQLAVLGHYFDPVLLADPAAAALLDPETLAPTSPLPMPLPEMQADGCVWLPVAAGQADTRLYLCRAIEAAGRPCTLVLGCPPAKGGEAPAWQNVLDTYHTALCTDAVTGAYNRHYLVAEYAAQAQRLAEAGTPPAVLLARVEQYAALCQTEDISASDRCLNAAAGLLGTALDPTWPGAVLARFAEDTFLLAAAVPAETLAAAVQAALARSRCGFSISLARRGTFTLALAAADAAEADGWQALLALACERLTAVPAPV